MVVRRELDRKIREKYIGKGINFSWTKTKPACAVEKTKKFKQLDFVRDEQPAAQAAVEVEESKEEQPKNLNLARTCAELEAGLTAEQRVKLDSLYTSEIGFTRVMQILIEAKKPLIAHNPQYDVGFLYEKFVAPMPPTFLEFCKEWR